MIGQTIGNAIAGGMQARTSRPRAGESGETLDPQASASLSPTTSLPVEAKISPDGREIILPNGERIRRPIASGSGQMDLSGFEKVGSGWLAEGWTLENGRKIERSGQNTAVSFTTTEGRSIGRMQTFAGNDAYDIFYDFDANTLLGTVAATAGRGAVTLGDGISVVDYGDTQSLADVVVTAPRRSLGDGYFGRASYISSIDWNAPRSSHTSASLSAGDNGVFGPWGVLGNYSHRVNEWDHRMTDAFTGPQNRKTALNSPLKNFGLDLKSGGGWTLTWLSSATWPIEGTLDTLHGSSRGNIGVVSEQVRRDNDQVVTVASLGAVALDPALATRAGVVRIGSAAERTLIAPEEILTAPGSLSAARAWTIKSRLNANSLPTSGRIRFVPERGYDPNVPLARGPNKGFLDRFGNEWLKGPSRTQGQAFEWDVQLSRTGRNQLGWASRDGSHLNVSLDGHVTHR